MKFLFNNFSVNIPHIFRYVILGTTNTSDISKKIKVEKTIIHKHFQSYGDDIVFQGENDIALIRLSENVQFTKYIQPICLPFSVENYEAPTIETNFTVAGWGNRRFTFNNEILEHLTIPFFPFDECEAVYDYYGRDLTDNSICAGGVVGENICFNDGGGPLMRLVGDQWVLDGIVTKIMEDGCATKNPAIFVKVKNYKRWITEHIIYGWDKEAESNDDDDKMVLFKKWEFWILSLLIFTIIAILMGFCCFLIKKSWKTQSKAIVIIFSIIAILITAMAIFIFFFFI